MDNLEICKGPSWSSHFAIQECRPSKARSSNFHEKLHIKIVLNLKCTGFKIFTAKLKFFSLERVKESNPQAKLPPSFLLPFAGFGVGQLFGTLEGKGYPIPSQRYQFHWPGMGPKH